MAVLVVDEIEDEGVSADIQLVVRGLTCVCPVNGLTDKFSVQVDYRPMRGRVLELGAFRALLGGYSDAAITHEALTYEVYATIVDQIHPESVLVTTVWEPVEGVECVVRMGA